ncbi:hypothetical protein JCM10908_001816 [Rhodotorula pacifica]|uniref:uncharacterized protein n=1 Tax=Rhodotorula pacifica TaxID=1495444 RepID=UPI0031716839
MAPKRTAAKKEESSNNNASSGSSNPTKSDRVIAVTAAEGYTGSALLELLASDQFRGSYSKLMGLTFGEPKDDVKTILEESGIETMMVDEIDEKMIKDLGVDTLCLIPPANKDKMALVKQILTLGKKAKSVQNVVFVSSAGADYAERDKQPRLREFIDLEVLAMQPKSDPSTGDTGHSPCIVRAGFYMENLLLYSKQAQGQGQLPIPIDPDHKFAPVSLGDVALLLATILTSKGPHGLGDEVRGQMIVCTGPQLVAGPELAEAASRALNAKLEFKSVSESEAKKILSSEQGEELDDAEREYLLEYYSLVREGKTNYVASPPAFKMVTGQDLTQPTDFFQSYQDSFKRKKRRTTK